MTSGIHFLDKSDILEIASACTLIKVNPGDTLITKNEPAGDLYIVADGSFKVFDDSMGEDFVHAILTKGDIFGEMSFLDGSPRSASVAALSNSSLLRMGNEEFDRLLQSNPETASRFLFALARVITGRLREVNNALTNITFNADRDSESDLIAEAISQMHIAVHIELTADFNNT